MKKTEVFCLLDENGNLFPPATQSTILAKYSRSPLSAKELVKGLTEEEANKFQDKWFISFNHSSVAELASIPVCFENISIVASKFIESYQRAGYSEKSTRYQQFSLDSFVKPPNAPASMRTFVKKLYDTYSKLQPLVFNRCALLMDKDPNDPETLKNRLVKARAFDNIRYLLPAGTGTNVGMVANCRDIKYMIRDALGHTNTEIQHIGSMTKDAVDKLFPVLTKNIEPDSFEPRILDLGKLNTHVANEWSVSLHRQWLLNDNNLVEATFQSMVAERYGMSWKDFSNHMNKRGERSVPKIFRNFKVQFDVVMDYGAYRDLQRHRRCEQYSEPLSTKYGYLVPDDILNTEMEPVYRQAMDHVNHYNDENVNSDSDLSQYVIPLGYLHRTVFDMDLQELYYIAELRTKPQGHISYRRVAYEMYKIASQLYPNLMQWCKVVIPDQIGEHT